MRERWSLLVLMVVAAVAASAQVRVRVEDGAGARADQFIVQRDAIGFPPVMAEFSGHTFEFLAPMGSFDKTVTGAPYSAEAVNESVQVLTDGNRIRRTSTTSLYRDAEGRTRRDQSLTAIGPWASSGEPPRMSFINDPVANVSYILDHNKKTARKITGARTMAVAGAMAGAVAIPDARAHVAGSHVVTGGANVQIITRSAQAGATHTRVASPFESTTEQLGKQNIEGVEAEGTRTTTTIPAGHIGNEQPIRIVSESWKSPDLQTVVMTKRTDPQFGETTYRLTRVNRADQPRSLFEVPADYTLTEESTREIRLQRRETPERTY